MCHAVRGGSVQGSGRDSYLIQRGDQTRINSKLRGWRAEFPDSLKGRRQGSWEHGREWDLSWRPQPPLCEIAWEAHLP